MRSRLTSTPGARAEGPAASRHGVEPGAESERGDEHRLRAAPAANPESGPVQAPAQREIQPNTPVEAPRFDDDEWEW